MKEWLEQGNGLILIGAVAGVGVLVRMLLFGYYGRLYKECKRFENSCHRVIMYIKKDLKCRVENGQKIKNVMTYTEYQLAECRILGVRMGWLENQLFYLTLFVLLWGVMAAFAGVWWGCEERTVLFLLFVSGVTVLGLLVTDMVLGLREKNRRIRLMLRDYIENKWSVRAEWMEDNLFWEELSEGDTKRTEKPKKVREKKGVSADKPVKIKARKRGKAQEEKRRLTEELLRERRQMEARSFANWRKREQEIPVAVEQLQQEVAITQYEEVKTPEKEGEISSAGCKEEETERNEEGSSYELLMRELLAEYLA